jgi:hypothetical protein
MPDTRQQHPFNFPYPIKGIGTKHLSAVWYFTCSLEGKFRWSPLMLSHCANPLCSTPFVRLREGKLFLLETESGAPVENPRARLPISQSFQLALNESTRKSRASPPMRKPPQRVDRYWLCARCSALWTLTQNEDRSIVLIPLTGSANRKIAARPKYVETA